MARDFSPISFFQRTPNALLGRYCQEKHGVLGEIAFDELEENGNTAEAIFQSFSALPEPQQAKIEAECQDIESMAHQAGVMALIDEATDLHKNAYFPHAINEQDSFQGKVMWAFLEHPNYWTGATSKPVRREHPRFVLEKAERSASGSSPREAGRHGTAGGCPESLFHQQRRPWPPLPGERVPQGRSGAVLCQSVGFRAGGPGMGRRPAEPPCAPTLLRDHLRLHPVRGLVGHPCARQHQVRR